MKWKNVLAAVVLIKSTTTNLNKWQFSQSMKYTIRTHRCKDLYSYNLIC